MILKYLMNYRFNIVEVVYISTAANFMYKGDWLIAYMVIIVGGICSWLLGRLNGDVEC